MRPTPTILHLNFVGFRHVSHAEVLEYIKGTPLSGAVADILNVLRRPGIRRRMMEASEVFGLPPLAAAVREIESLEEVVRCLGRRRSKVEQSRFKDLAGACVTTVMSLEGFELMRSKSGRPMRSRLDRLPVKPKYFEAANRYRRKAEVTGLRIVR
jgi:hypothetical protein